jgi:hypothetical protein
MFIVKIRAIHGKATIRFSIPFSRLGIRTSRHPLYFYPSTLSQRSDVSVAFVNPSKTLAVHDVLKANTKIVFYETLANPTVH